jgi:hypothetical protein
MEHNNTPYQPQSQLPEDHACWEQVCSAIHAINPNPLQSSTKRWTTPTAPLRHRNHQHLLGQTVLLPPHRADLPARTGTITLIAENSPHNTNKGNPTVYIHPDKLKPPHIPTPCVKCDTLDTNPFTHCNECNRPCHTACTPNSVTTTPEKWHCRRCIAKTRVPHTTTMTLRETHTSIKRLTKLAHSRRIAETEQRAKDLKSVESKYPHEDIIVLASPPKKIRITTKKHIFNGPWQLDMADKQPPIIDTWNITPTGPNKSKTAGDFGYQLHIECIKIAYDLENSPPTTQPDDTNLRARANTWKTKLARPHQNTPPTTPLTEVLHYQEQTRRPPHTLSDTYNPEDNQHETAAQTPLCDDQPNPHQLCPLEITPHEHHSDDTIDLNEADREDDDHTYEDSPNTNATVDLDDEYTTTHPIPQYQSPSSAIDPNQDSSDLDDTDTEPTCEGWSTEHNDTASSIQPPFSDTHNTSNEPHGDRTLGLTSAAHNEHDDDTIMGGAYHTPQTHLNTQHPIGTAGVGNNSGTNLTSCHNATPIEPTLAPPRQRNSLNRPGGLEMSQKRAHHNCNAHRKQRCPAPYEATQISVHTTHQIYPALPKTPPQALPHTHHYPAPPRSTYSNRANAEAPIPFHADESHAQTPELLAPPAHRANLPETPSIMEKPAGWRAMSKGERKRWRKRARPSV